MGCRDEESSAVQSESPSTPGSAPPLVEPPGVSESKAVKHEKLFFSCCCVRSLTLSLGSACGAQRGWEAGAEPADSAAQTIRVGLQRGSRWATLVPTSTALYVTASRDTRTVHSSARATHSPGELLFTADNSGASHPVFAPPAALLRPSVHLVVLPASPERCSYSAPRSFQKATLLLLGSYETASSSSILARAKYAGLSVQSFTDLSQHGGAAAPYESL